jgi:diguanylate cyclase (GGDEF)-like protein
LLFIDLDGFKEVNDSLGHAAGDEVLRQVATRLSGCLREADTIARHGGDEFVVLLEDVEGPEEVEQVTARMQAVLAQPFAINGRRVRVTSSIGVALYPCDGETLSVLIERSDLAMYRAKELGRNRVQFYLPELACQSMLPRRSAFTDAPRIAAHEVGRVCSRLPPTFAADDIRALAVGCENPYPSIGIDRATSSYQLTRDDFD